MSGQLNVELLEPRRLFSVDNGVGSIIGAGNFTNGDNSAATVSQFDALNTLGGKLARINLYPNYYYNDSTSTVNTSIDGTMLTASQKGITPIVLFEYYHGYSNPIGGYSKWFSIGQTYATRYSPGGTWGVANGVPNFGVKVFTAFNEPDHSNGIPKASYTTALQGLADGVHSVNASLKVLPGGFMRANAASDYTLNGYGPAIAPLLNNGTLAGIDLHTYMDVQYAPMAGTYQFSAQKNFDMVKGASGINADIEFYATEFNFKKRLVTEQDAAKGFFTSIWDHIGVVKNDGSTQATELAMPWNLFFTPAQDDQYGIAQQLSPWTGTSRGQTLQTVINKTAGMTMVSSDPLLKGEYVLNGNHKKMWVWQNRSAWTNQTGTSYTVNGIPTGVTAIEVYGWNGLRQTVTVSGQQSITVSSLPGDETYMFLATFTSTNAPSGLAATGVSPVQTSLSWIDNGNGAQGFTIERKLGPGGTYAQVGTVGNNITGYTDSGVSAGTQYFYRVKAVNAPTTYSNEANVTTPTGSYFVNDNNAGISWSGNWYRSVKRGLGDYNDDARYTPTNNDSFQFTFSGTGIDYITEKNSDMGNVMIYLNGTLQGTYSCFNSSRLTQQTVFSTTNLPAGTHTLRVVNASAAYMLLDALKVYPVTAPAAPSSLSATPTSSSQINLTWTDNSSNETGFKVERATDSLFTQNLTLVATTAANATSFSNTGLTASTTYHYRLRATNASGDSTNSNTANATTQASSTLIVTNGNFSTGPTGGASFGTGSTLITGWTVIGGGGVERYNGNFGFPTWNVQLNPSPTSGSGGVQQTTNLVTVVGQQYQIGIDFGARAEGANRTAKAVVTFGTQTFNLLDGTNAGNDSIFTNHVFTATATSTSTLFSVLSAPYVDTTTTWKGIIDNVSVVALAPTIPAAPSGLTATTASASQINLTWTDNSSNETGFKVERATDSLFTQNLTLVTTTAVNATSFADTGLSASTTYYYRVRATNAAGDSTNSNSANATTSV